MSDYLDVIFWSLIGGLFSIIGGVLLLADKKVALKIGAMLTPFAAGALLGAAFFDLLPEAIELGGGQDIFRWTVVGILAFFLLEHYLHWFHHHEDHEEKKKPTVPLIIIGDTLHNAIDGVVIGAAFVVNPALGVVTAIAVAAHEIPQEIGDFSILLKAGMRRRNVLLWNALSALATVATALLTFELGSSSSIPLPAILGLAAGLFIYIAMSDLIPDIHAEAKGRFKTLAILLIVFGVVTVGLITDIAHERVHEAGHQSHSQEESSHHESEHEHESEHDHGDDHEEH